MAVDRGALLERTELRGSAFTDAYTKQLDQWLQDIATSTDLPAGVALAAVGGFGRREMSPESDIDIILVHSDDVDVAEIAEQLWYPIWDAGLKLGHRVDTVDGLLKSARNDLDTATALLDVRHLAGDESVSLELAVEASAQWSAGAVDNASRLAARRSDRHDQHGEVAFELGPDLKNGRGGLRDVHSLRWAAASGVLSEDAATMLADAHEVLLAARVELHRLTGRPGDRLVLDYQDEVAVALDYKDADALMADVAGAARTIAWNADAAWFFIERSVESRRRSSDVEHLDNGIVIDGALLSLEPDFPRDPMMLFNVAKAAASRHCFIDNAALDQLCELKSQLPDPWTAEMRDAFTDIFRLGRAAIPVIEAYDQVGLMTALIPQWESSRSRPQRNAYHRFTVDRHLLEAAAEASALTDKVDRPDLLVLGALLHDIGKGYPGDHTDVGVELIADIAPHMGFDAADTELLVDMCRYHLLLPDVATRRDLDDDGTIEAVAGTVGSVRLLELLGSLTEADSIATGPSAWNASKAELVRTLVGRVRFVLEGGEAADTVGQGFPGPRERAFLDSDEFVVDIDGPVITVVQSDAAGAFSRVAGVLTLNGLDITGAAAHTEGGRALSQFTVNHTDFDHRRLRSQMIDGVSGRLAVGPRVEERRNTYARSFKRSSAAPINPSVSFDNMSSETATVIEVTCRDQIGVLYRIARALSEMQISISTARIQTIGDRVVDAFYVMASDEKIVDPGHQSEVERAVLYAIARK